MNTLKSQVSAVLQYKCEYLSTVQIYTKRAAVTMPDISDLDVKECKEFLMYVPVEPMSGARGTVCRHFYSLPDWGTHAFGLASFADKLCTLRHYVDGCAGGRVNEYNPDVYRWHCVKFGATVIDDLEVLCVKNKNFYHLLLSVLVYEMHVRLDFFVYFTMMNIQTTARTALEYLISLKVYAQFVLGMLWIALTDDPSWGKYLYVLCNEILEPAFYPDHEPNKYRFLFSVAQHLRLLAFSGLALVNDPYVSLQPNRFLINSGDDNSVDMYSVHVYAQDFLQCLSREAGVAFDGGNCQLAFNVTFSDALPQQTCILKHINKTTK
ncbi:orf146-like protein [Peridroma alphabaculovirus]|uniref:Orf146-like protein n=1 Tax=Peridroma alphabaculovirus TaxID=1346829 RepID=A0A068LL21_9ABAC|nr:orf146-like protein [Peridroma alphabaculovirus]AIE47843.1 orf146-like protein [Peridroma alphabaculovirus]